VTAEIAIALIFLSGLAVGLAVRSLLWGFLGVSALPILAAAVAFFLSQTGEDPRAGDEWFSTVDLLILVAIFFEILIVPGWLLGQLVQLVRRRGWLSLPGGVDE
jgi:hypothetical protein